MKQEKQQEAGKISISAKKYDQLVEDSINRQYIWLDRRNDLTEEQREQLARAKGTLFIAQRFRKSTDEELQKWIQQQNEAKDKETLEKYERLQEATKSEEVF